MNRVLLIPAASPLHDPNLVERVLNVYQRNLSKIIDGSLPLITRREDLERDYFDENVLGIIAPLTGGTEHLIQYIFERCRFILLLPHNSMNSLPAALEIFSKVKHTGKAWIILEWPPGRKTQKFLKAWRVVNEIKKMKIGLIGEPSPWLVYSSGVDVEKGISQLFEGLTLLRIGLSEIYHSMEEFSDLDLHPLTQELIRKARTVHFQKNELAKSIRIYLSLKKIFEKYSLDAATIGCFDIIRDTGTTACLAASLFNCRVSVFGCEGDLPALLTMMLFSKLAEAPAFMGNISWIQNNILTLTHCTAPLTIANKFELDTHYESGKGVGVRCFVPTDRKATIGRLDPISKILRYTVGRTIKRAFQEQACRTQINIKIQGSGKSGINNLTEESIGNHYIIVLKDISEELKYVARIIGVRLERI